MTVLMVPNDKTKYPTLGPQVCDFIEQYLVFGPGDLRGQPAILDAEKRALIYRIYEVFPPGTAQAGRRRFKRVGISLRKGTAKTELAAWLAAVELHPDGPVRCDGFDAHGNPVGIGVTDPYIPMVAYTEEQSDELAYGALKVMLEYSPLVGDFDIGIERIMRVHGDGKAISLAGAPNARDGARTTFQIFDETHRLNTPRLKAAHGTMLANIPKRKLSDAWSFEITTAPAPGEDSVAERTMHYARQVADGVISDSRLFFFHREASDKHDLSTEAGIRAAVVEASGPSAAWSDIDGIIEQWRDPTSDKTYLERVWLNRLVRSSQKAFDVEQWKALTRPDYLPEPGRLITMGFDGSRWQDATAIVCTEIATGFQWLAGIWEAPLGIEDWEVPEDEVRTVIDNMFSTYQVWRMYCDPPYWQTTIADWAGRYGDKVVVNWWTNRIKPMAYAIQSFNTALLLGDMSNDGHPRFERHIGHAARKILSLTDDDGKPMWLIYKDRPASPNKIDAAMAAILSWEAYCDAITSGVGQTQPSIYEEQTLKFV